MSKLSSTTYENWEGYGKAVQEWAGRTFGCAKFSIPATREAWTGLFYLRFVGDEKAPIPLELSAFEGQTAEELGGLVWITAPNPIPWGSGWIAGMARDGKRNQFIQNSNIQLSFEGTPPGCFLFEDQVWDRHETSSSPRTGI